MAAGLSEIENQIAKARKHSWGVYNGMLGLRV